VNRPVTIVINTYNRCQSLALTLQSLEWLDYDNFEVVVVNGPSTDGTDALLAGMPDRVKVARCENRNLSESRNIGIRMASGDIVAFIDDDAYPDPAWLNDLVSVFAWDEVAAVGGPVFAHTGYDLQVWYSRADRLGRFWTDFESSPNPSQLLAFPGSQQFTYTIGTNSLFRRDRLVELGGFDEEFAYYLDETDLCCRFVDAGYVVAAQERGFVYHKFLPSDIRERSDVVRDWYQILKSKFYFTLKHGVEAFSFAEVCDEQSTFVDQIRYNVLLNFEAGIHDQEVVDKFERDVREASDRAFDLFGSEGADAPKTRPASWFGHNPDGFLPFRVRTPEGRKLHVCFLCQEYPPATVNGIGRVVHSLATGLAARGHVVRVLTMGEIQNRVDLEDGVWVHRMVPTPHDAPDDVVVPAHIWDYAASLLEELHRIDAMRAIDVVQGPNWDSEGIAVLQEGRFPYVVALYTPLKTVAAMDPVMRGHIEGGAQLIPQLIELETHVYEHADGYLACGPAIVEQIEADYGITIPAERLGLVPHGLADQSTSGDDAAGNARPRLLFVGRLEARKGIDTMLQAAVRLTELGVDYELAIVGDDGLEGPGGCTYREQFEREHPELASRVFFLGRVDDEELRRQYQTCDVFVAPSRFESFGLILLEAMMFAKPVVAADIGGLAEILQDGVSGFLVPPDDPERLATTLTTLLESPELRTAIGTAGRRAFEERFTVDRMSAGAEAFYGAVARRREPAVVAV
jgi:glycogen(starch) synthase